MVDIDDSTGGRGRRGHVRPKGRQGAVVGTPKKEGQDALSEVKGVAPVGEKSWTE